MTDLQVRQGYANGTLTDCDECGATMKNGGECEDCKNRVSCEQCAACMIQGVFCHETGCPNTHSRFDAESGEWVKQIKCGECGSMVDEDEFCCDDEQDDDFEMLEHEDTDSLEDYGITLGSYES